MASLSRRSVLVISATCVLLGIYGWAIFFSSFSHDGTIGPHYNAPGGDWIVFYSAARAYISGNLSLLYDGRGLTDYQNALFAHWLLVPKPLSPWLYPPHFLLLVLPFALLPFLLSYATFVTATFAALVAAVWCYFRAGERKLQILSLLLCPASSITVLTGQNAFLCSALLFGGFAAIARYPIFGGALLGVLSFKPSLWLMTPVALVAARQWRALAAALGTALLLALASAALFGIDVWLRWIEVMVSPAADWFETGRSWGLSLYTCVSLIGASSTTANLVQTAGTLSAAAAVFWSFSQPLARDRQLIVLLAATILAAPHVSSYDTVFLAIAAGLLLRGVPLNRLPFHEVLVVLAAWLLPLANPPRATPLGLATPVIVAFMIACGATRTPANAPMAEAAI